MKMITGGAFQGKSDYGKKIFHNINEWIDGSDCTMDQVLNCQGINHFHLFIRRMLKNEEDINGVVDKLIKENKEVIIILDEVGSGIVPMDPFERKYREQVGRAGTKLAEASDEVHRVVSGIGMVIKGV